MDKKAVRQYLKRWRDPRSDRFMSLVEQDQTQAALALAEALEAMPISVRLQETSSILQLIVGSSTDVVMRELVVGADLRRVNLFFVDGMVNDTIILKIVENLAIRLREEHLPKDAQGLFLYLKMRGLVSSEVTTVRTLAQAVTAVLSGDTVIVVEGLDIGIQVSTRGWEHRQPEEPTAEPVVWGPKEGFTETAAVNLALVRRRLQDPRLRVETLHVGTRTRTVTFMVYLEGLTTPSLVDEVRRRLKQIEIDGVVDSGYIEELIADTTLTPFPLMKVTERPDVVTANILEGRVALLVDGTPHSLLMPSIFADGMQAAEDYYQKWTNGSFARLVRYFFLIVALLGPATYIALLTFHQEMLPTNLLLSITSAREGVPFPALVEALLMEFSFEALREAGVRLPKTVGQAVSIVGALVIGEASVRAGLVSPAMVIVVAITGISSFVIPLYSSALAIRLLRFPMMFLAGSFGFFGIATGLIALSIHLASLRSFGVPYMSPTMPPAAEDLKDLMIRAPWWWMRHRPQSIPMKDRKRMRGTQKPVTPEQAGDSRA